jgi:hypothetical protein
LNSMRSASPAVHLSLPSTPSRGLGEAFALPRAIYVTNIPALLVVTGLITWIAGNEMAMVVAAAVGGAVSLYMLWDWLFREGPTRFSTLTAIALLMGYGLGALNTWLTLPRGGLSLAQYFGGDEAAYARGMAAVLIASAPLCLLGELYERPVFGAEFRVPLDQRTYLFIFLGTGCVIAGFLTNSLGYSGTQVTYGEQTSAGSALVASIFPPLTALTVATFPVTRGRARLLVGACGLILCTLLMVIGRRNLIYTAMLMFFAMRLTGYRLRGTFYRKVFLIAAGGVFLAIGLTVFMLLRLAGFQTRGGHAPLIQRIQIALSWVEDGTALGRATEANQTNVQSRTFVLGFFADVLDASTRRTPALGKDLAGYTSEAIPRVLNPDKDLEFSEERLVDSEFGLTYTDAANSILTNGATDFGIFGVLLYPLALAALFRFIVSALSGLLQPLPVTFIVLVMMMSAVQTEIAITGYLVTIRNVIIWAFLLSIFSFLPQITLRNR